MALPRFSLRARSLLILLVPVAALLLMLAAFFFAQQRSTAVEREATRASSAIFSANTALIALVDSETGVRGYLLTRDKHFLEPYNWSLPAIPGLLQRLAADVPAGSDRAKRATSLATRGAEALASLQYLLNLDAVSHARAIQAVARGYNKRTMDAFRVELLAFREKEVSLRDERRRGLERLWAFLDGLILSIGSLAIAATLLANWYFMRSIVARLGFLRAKSAQFAAGGEPGEPMTGWDEISQVDSAFHRMADLRQEAERALALSRDQAMEASRFKSQFVATMSHEIRTPMNGVIGMTDLLLRTRLNAEQREYGETIRQSAAALLGVINDILDFSKLEAGKFELEILNFDPVTVVEATADLLAVQASKKRLSLMTYIAPDVPRNLGGDPARLRQILVNLLGNALKFTEHGGVACSVSLAEASPSAVVLRFEVNDTGIGLTPEAASRLFQPFMQADGTTTRKYGGTGLGLSISKHLVEVMGGTIGVHSLPGAGSTFWFTARFEPLRAPGEAAPLHIRNLNLQDLRVLILDDDAGARNILGSYVESWGMCSTAVREPAEALRLLRAAALEGRPYHIAVIDLVMPEMDGVAVAMEIGKDPALVETRLVLISAYDRSSRVNECNAAGFSAYLAKPVRQSQLFNTITSLMLESDEPQPSREPESFEFTGAVAGQFAQGLAPVLLAEDHPVNQRLAALQLEQLGIQVETVANGREAASAVVRQKYSLVLMDCQMPEMDGFDATRAIRRAEIKTGGRIPIIAMTANAMESDRENCLACGMDDYIAKPVTIETLRDVLRRWMPQHAESG